MKPISVCIIVKNEETRLKRLLDSLKPYPFEIVVVDTGSCDNTKQVALSAGAKVYDFEWCDDFSAARNYSLSVATNNWILMMDSDEWVESIDTKELDYFQKNLAKKCGSVSRHNQVGTPGNITGQTLDYTERFFNRKNYKYEGRIHEQLIAKPGTLFDTMLLNLHIGHDGYVMTPQERTNKSMRNVSLLELDLKEHPGDIYLTYQLGKGYEMIADYPKVCSLLAPVFTNSLDVSLAYVQAMILCYGNALMRCERFEEAYTHYCAFSTQLADSSDYLYQYGKSCLAVEQYEQALDAFEAAIKAPVTRKQGTNSYLSYFEIARILLLVEERDMAIQYLQQCGNYPPAVKVLEQLQKM